MFRKIIGTILIFMIIIGISGCSFNMPVFANNKNEKYLCYKNRIIIEVANNTPKNRLLIPQAVEKALLKAYSNQPNTRKKHVHTENFSELEKRCRKKAFKYATNLSAVEAGHTIYNNCMDISGPRTTITYTGESYSIDKQNSSDEDTLLNYYISAKYDSNIKSFDFTIKVDGNYIVIYIVGRNGCIEPYYISKIISNIVKKYDKPYLGLKYYKL